MNTLTKVLYLKVLNRNIKEKYHIAFGPSIINKLFYVKIKKE